MAKRKLEDAEILQTLITCGGVSAAAQALDVSKAMIFNRLKDDTFRSQYDCLQGIILSDVSAALVARTSAAANLLADVVENPAEPTGTRVNAANCMLGHCLRYVEAANILRRLDALEKAQAGA